MELAQAPRPGPGVTRYLAATSKWTVYGVLIGILAGFAAIVFHVALEAVGEYLFQAPAGYDPPSPGQRHIPGSPERDYTWWLIVLIPAAGGLLAGLLVWRFCPEAGGDGTNGMIRSFHRDNGRVKFRVMWVKLLASVFTIGSGGSAGREGPSTQIGGAIGSSVARLFRLSERDCRILLLAGSSAGVGAIFRAPLGGALFSGEVLYRDTDNEAEALIPCVVASIVAYSVFIGFLPGAPTEGTFAVDKTKMVFDDPTELVWYAVLGCLCALMGLVYVKALGVIEKIYRALRVPRMVLPAIGGASLGLFALVVGAATQNINYNVFGGGHGLIQAAMDESFTWTVLLILLLAKIVATGITLGSGGSGGLFAPSLAIGALLGGLVGGVLVDLQYVQHAGPFVLVGMGGFFAGVGKVPITAVIMVSEITKSYELLAPIMLAAAIAFQLSRNWTLFEEQVNNRLVSPAHSGDFVVDVLEQLYVKDVYDAARQPTLIKESTPLRRVLILVAQSDSRYFPVVDANDRMTGIFSLTDIRRVMTEHE
ncbi:MAG: chloride channel protein, partial [Planctomycetota bacterium]